MFFSKIIEKLSFPIAIVLVIAGVLIFSFFDPFGIFSPQKVKLKDTPITVESIKQIGELITAEYYGEVVQSLGEAINEDVEIKVSAFQDSIIDLNDEFMDVLVDFRNENPGKRTSFIHKQLTKTKRGGGFENEDYARLRQNKRYVTYITYIDRMLKTRKFGENQFDIEAKYNENAEKRVFRNVIEGIDEQREALIRSLLTNDENEKSGIWSLFGFGKNNDNAKEPVIQVNDVEWLSKMDFSQLYETKREAVLKANKQKYKNGKLVLLGRGWVKAGFDFQDFSQKNFKYDEDHGIVHFIGMEPEILSATINPWFIPERKIPGFEILIAERRSKRDVENLDTVKTRCLNKLRNNALKMDILNKAKENATMHLEGFFSLLLGKDIKVQFYTDEYKYLARTLLEDDKITDSELLVIDSMFVRSIRYWENDRVRTSCLALADTLRKYPVYINNIKASSIDRGYASLAYEVLKDYKFTKVDSVRLDTFAALLQKLSPDSLNNCGTTVIRDKDQNEVTYKANLLRCEEKFGQWPLPLMKIWHPEAYGKDQQKTDFENLIKFIELQIGVQQKIVFSTNPDWNVSTVKLPVAPANP